MSGSSIPYQLRQNKAIERNLFIDLLSRIGRVKNISDYEYIGFGGPFLEDFKALHAALRINKMQSIEGDINTYARQKFNLPFKFLTLHNKQSSAFFSDHQFSESGTIVWLDYTASKDLGQQLNEFRSVVEKVNYFDVVKITLNASPAEIPGKKGDHETIQEARLRTLKENVGSYLPAEVNAENMVFDEYPKLLQQCVQNAVAGLSSGETKRYFQILSSFVYADGQQMITVTGIVLDASKDDDKQAFLDLSRLAHWWPFANLHWQPPIPISVPALSAKERMKLDENLPVQGDDSEVVNTLQNALGYVPGTVSDVQKLANYARYYRAYPHFSRVIL